MCKRLLFVFCFVLAVLCAPDQVYAQFTDPRTYENTPVGLNELEVVNRIITYHLVPPAARE